MGEARKGRSRTAAATAPGKGGGDLNFGSRNYTILAAALVCVLVGFLTLSRGSITLAPILLVLGYCVLVPYGLATGRRDRTPSGE
jgi:hypothetical protein